MPVLLGIRLSNKDLGKETLKIMNWKIIQSSRKITLLCRDGPRGIGSREGLGRDQLGRNFKIHVRSDENRK